MDNLELLKEAQKRGLLPPEKSVLLEEAQRRGIIKTGGIDTVTPEKPSGMVSIGRGMMDLYQGVKELGLKASDILTGSNDAPAYAQQVNEEIANYERGRGPNAGFDFARLAGNIATPALAIPGGVGVSLPARMATGAATGAGQAGLMFAPNGESRGGNMIAGGVGGAIAPAAVQGLSNLFRSGANTSANAVASAVRAGIDDAEVVRQVERLANQSGIDLQKLTAGGQQALLNEAKKQLQVGQLNPEALQRVAEAAALDPRLKLTRGQATRSPMDWQTEQNLRGIQGVGDELRQRFGGQGQILTEAAERIRGRMGAPTDRPFQAAENVISTIQGKFKDTGDIVSELYKEAGKTVGLQADVPMGPLQTRAMQILNDFDDVVPAPIKARLNALGIDRMGTGKASKAFTVEEAEALDKLINKRWDASNRPLTAALSGLKGAIKESLEAIGDDAGTDAARAFRIAKDKAAARFDEFGQRIASAATDDVAPDKFLKKFVIGGDVRDIKSLVNTLTTGTPEQIAKGSQALNSIRAATLTELFEGKGAFVDGMLSGAKLDKALRDMGPDRIKAIFTPDQVKQLELLRKVSLDLTKPPPLADINYSRTSGALANLLNSIGKVPGLGVVGKIGQSEVERVQKATAQKALAGGAAIPAPAREVITKPQANELARRFAPYVTAPAGFIANALAQ